MANISPQVDPRLLIFNLQNKSWTWPSGCLVVSEPSRDWVSRSVWSEDPPRSTFEPRSSHLHRKDISGHHKNMSFLRQNPRTNKLDTLEIQYHKKNQCQCMIKSTVYFLSHGFVPVLAASPWTLYQLIYCNLCILTVYQFDSNIVNLFIYCAWLGILKCLMVVKNTSAGKTLVQFPEKNTVAPSQWC